MIKFKNYIIPILFCATCISCEAQITLDDIIVPKSPSYRVGISEIPENIYVRPVQQEAIKKITRVKKDDFTPIASASSYNDIKIKDISKEISQELEFDEQDMVSDLSLLWQGAATQSDTINFALQKLANPDADKPKKQTVKNILTTVASMSSLIGAGISNPLLAGSSLIGGNIMGIMSQDTKALNYKYTKVTDADMIILIRKVEDLQQNAVNLYYDYMTAKQQLQMVTKLVHEREEKYKLAQANNASREMVVITDAYYRTALDKQKNARSDFMSKRAALEQFVGNEVLHQFEHDLAQREYNSQNQVNYDQSQEAKQEYAQTVQDVEAYTTKLNENSENKLAYNYQDTEDKYMDQLPELRPLSETETDIQEDMQQMKYSAEDSAKSAQNAVEETKTKLSKKERKAAEKLKKQEQKIAQQKAKAEEKANEKIKKKYDKYSTKGLIFLHDKDKTDVKQETQTSVSDKTQTKKQSAQDNKTTPSTQRKPVLPSGLLPLDEIQRPELKPGGYSIHSYYGE